MRRSIKKRYKHDWSHYHNLTLAAGTVNVIGVKEVLANTSIMGHTEGIVRTLPLKSPVMHPLRVKIVNAFVPTRHIWDDAEAFFTGGEEGSTLPVHPTMTVDINDCGVGSLLDQLGFTPLEGSETATINALPVRAYQKFILDHAIDQDLTTRPTLNTGSGNDTTTTRTGFLAAWAKDWATTCRPWPQKGDAVPIPQSNVVSNGQFPTFDGNAGGINERNLAYNSANSISLSGAASGVNGTATFGDETGLEMDDSATVDDLNIAVAMQRYFRKRTGWGGRFIDYFRNAFGSTIQDKTLKRSVIVSQGVKTIQFSEVLQTAEGTSPLGTMAGHGLAGLSSNAYKFYAEEHGFFLTVAVIMPEPFYMTATEKIWWKTSPEDYFIEEFENIGNTPVYNGMIFGRDASPKGTWAYNEPYDDYKYSLNRVSGLMRTTYNYWHMARNFLGTPTLNNAFLHQLPTDRIFQVEDPDSYQFFAYNKMIVRQVVKRRTPQRIL